MIGICKISGDSMLPHYKDGDYVVYLSALFGANYSIGQCVVVQHADYGLIIKRIAKVREHHNYGLKSESGNGLNEQQLGVVHRGQIKGRVIWHIQARNPATKTTQN